MLQSSKKKSGLDNLKQDVVRDYKFKRKCVNNLPKSAKEPYIR